MIYFFDIETASLDAFSVLGRVTMIGLMDEKGECQFYYDLNEKKLLEDFWGFVSQHTATYACFNGLSFDFSYLVKRSIVLGVKPYMLFRRWLLDLRNVIDSSPYAKGSLQTICQLINGEHKYENMEGEMVIQLFHDGDYEKLKSYLTQDLRLTQILYTRLCDCGVIQ